MDPVPMKETKSKKWCTVLGCKSQGESMFGFPKDEEKRLQWKEACRLVKDVTNYTNICSRHFSDTDLITTAAGKRLKKDAIPSKHLPSEDSLILRKLGERSCIVRGCNYGLNANDTLHRFPVSVARQDEWKTLVQVESVSERTMICSRHFKPTDFTQQKNGKKVLNSSACPTLHLPGALDDTCCQGSECLSSNKWKAFCKKCQMGVEKDMREVVQDKEDSVNVDSSDCEPEELPISVVVNEVRESVLFGLNQSESADVNSVLTQLETAVGEPRTLESLIQELNVSEEDVRIGREERPIPVPKSTAPSVACATQTDLTFIRFNLLNLIQTDMQCKSFVGVDLRLLNSLAKLCEIYKPVSHNSALTMKERVAMVLCKLYLNISFECLSILFGVSRQVCSHTFSPTVQILHHVLSSTIPWPSKEDILKNMPMCFKKFRDTRVVLDCTEIPVDSPSCLQCRIRMYSHYKGRLTVKVLLGVAPSGLITYRSKCYGGKASDQKMFAESTLITENLLDPFTDAVMVDKGFKIGKLLEERNIKMHQPPFVINKMPLSAKAANFNVAVAVARVHVERVIQRMKLFRILSDKIPWYVVPDIDCIFTIICGLVNLSSPILSKERFMTQSDCHHTSNLK